MSTSQPNPVLHHIVKKIVKVNNIENYKYNVDGGTGKAEGYMGEIVFFHILINNQKLNFVLKSEKSQEHLKIIGSDIMNNRELEMYTKVVPALEDLVKSKNWTELSKFIPKLWFAEKHFNRVNIVLENLSLQNFHVRDRKKPMDFGHMKTVFETYGKWHGATMALKDQQPDKFYKLTGSWCDTRYKLVQEFGFIEQFSREFAVIRNMFIEQGRFDLVDIYEGFEEKMEEVLLRENVDEKDLMIISHGDQWSTNYFFKYKDNFEESTPNQVYLIDFQQSRLDSPALELSSALYNMGDKQNFEKLDQLLSLYHQSLSKTLKILGSDPDELFTMDDLRRHWKKHGLYSVAFGFVYLRIALCNSEEAPDLGRMAENREDFNGAFSFDMQNMETFWRRAFDVFVHFGEFLKQFSSD